MEAKYSNLRMLSIQFANFKLINEVYTKKNYKKYRKLTFKKRNNTHCDNNNVQQSFAVLGDHCHYV